MTLVLKVLVYSVYKRHSLLDLYAAEHQVSTGNFHKTEISWCKSKY